MFRHKIIANGTAVENLLVGDKSVKSCKQEMRRKYTFASLENCSNKFFGKNVAILYLAVVTRLPARRICAFCSASLQNDLKLSDAEVTSCIGVTFDPFAID
mmetsp:Transcript_13954/g.32854  ORF Transcript_13954/g.32854 Transcript_13954/m.32854 type:complete len:101 (-) Transcript_13954:465-767(-)